VGLVSLSILPKKISMLSQRVHANEPLWFINFKSNEIQYAPTIRYSERFSDLVKKVRTAGQQITILHIGDSHVQADVFTGETRKLMASWLNDNNCARGFTFPHQIVGSNNPDDYSVTWKGQWKRVINSPRVGIFGVTAQSADWGSEFSIKLSNKADRSQYFDRVRIFFDAEDTQIFPFVRDEGTLVHRDMTSATYKLIAPTNSVTIGNSISRSAQTALNLHGIELTNSKSKLLYHAIGVNGASVNTFLQSEYFEQQTHKINPQVVIVSLGTNDVYNPAFCQVTFKKNLKKLIAKIRSACPNSMIILTTPGDHLINKAIKNTAIAIAQLAIQDVAHAEGCGVWDFFKVMGGDGSINLWAEKGLCAPDMLHLNRKGYRLKGALLFDALSKLDNDNPIHLRDNQLMVND
jgi:lysophospholipase L1-like esterase